MTIHPRNGRCSGEQFFFFFFAEDGLKIWLFDCRDMQSSLLRLLPVNQEEDLHVVPVFSENHHPVHSQEEREENAKRIPCPFLAGSPGGGWAD